MKSGVWVLDHDTGYRKIKKDLLKRCGKAPGLKFERTGTPGMGVNRCDFCLKEAK